MDHSSHSFLLSAFVFLAAAVLIVPLARKSGFGSVLGYLFAGILIGPYGLSLITEAKDIMHFAELGVVLMLFLIGMELNPRTLWAMRKPIVGLGGIQVVLTALIIAATLSFFFKWQVAVCIALALSLSSTAMVLQIMSEKNLTKKKVGRHAFSVLLFQDIAVIPILAILPVLVTYQVGGTSQGGESHNMTESLPAWVEPFKIIGATAAIFFIGRYVIQHALDYISTSRMREIFTASSLLLVIGITLLMQSLGLSAALGAFVAGVVLANSEYRHTLEADIEPFKGLLLGLFFISVGMSINFDVVLAKPLLIILGVLSLMVLKGLILFGLARLFRMQPPYNYTFSFILCQAGEFAFVIMQAGLTQGVVTGEIATIVSAIVALSMLITPFLMMLNDRVSSYLYRNFKEDNPEYDTIEGENCPVIIAGFGRMGQVIGRLLTAQGYEPVILEQDPAQINLLRHYGNKVYFGDAMRLDVLRAAGIEKARMIVITLGSPEAALSLTKMVREHYPHIRIVVRGRNRRHAYELHKAGADIVRREILDSSLWLGRKVLEGLGMGRFEARNKAMLFQHHDEDVLQHSYEFFDNEKELLSFSRQTNKELEQILADDRRSQHHAHTADGWGNAQEDEDAEAQANKGHPHLSTATINSALEAISNDNDHTPSKGKKDPPAPKDTNTDDREPTDPSS